MKYLETTCSSSFIQGIFQEFMGIWERIKMNTCVSELKYTPYNTHIAVWMPTLCMIVFGGNSVCAYTEQD